MFSSPIKLVSTLLLICSIHLLSAQSVPRGDSIQVVLQNLAQLQKANEIVKLIPETQRWYLTIPHNQVSDDLLEILQNAFFHDIESYCKYYGWKYLIDWRVLASKAARESFWGTSYLSNRTRNYFGIRTNKKEWMCASFGHCDGIMKDDPEPSSFAIFPDFDASLWMFIHTIYSRHYLERLPDEGSRVVDAIFFERKYGIHYWNKRSSISSFKQQLSGETYTSEEIIYTWSEHPFNNLCVNCNRRTDQLWVGKIDQAIARTGI